MPARFPLIRRLLTCACAAVGFGAASVSLHRAFPPYIAEVTPKLQFLAAHAERFDTLFIGSSRVYHGLSPLVFDFATAAAGQPCHSFNLGIDGMVPPESFAMVRRVLALRLPHLRRVFLEMADSRGIPDSDTPTARDIYWQDGHSLWLSLRLAGIDLHTGRPQDRLPRAWKDLSCATSLFLRNQFNTGRFIPEPDPPTAHRSRPSLPEAALGPGRDGYVPVHHPMSAAELQQLANATDTLLHHRGKPRPRNPLNTDGYDAMRALLAGRGIQLILITTPTTTREFNTRVDAPAGIPLLTFDHPETYPDLYRADHRFDSDHLNEIGAREFTALLAASFAALPSPKSPRP